MNLLLDTHVFIWAVTDSARLSDTVHDLLSDTENIKWMSLVSVWEIQIKSQIGKLTFKQPILELIDQQQKENDLRLLPI